MAEAGLLDEWRSRFQRDNGHCVDKKKQKGNRQTQTNNRITLKNLSGAFVVLFVGYLTSIFLFIGELILYRFCPGQQSDEKKVKEAKSDGGKNTAVIIEKNKLATDTLFGGEDAKTIAVVVAKSKTETIEEIEADEPDEASSKVIYTVAIGHEKLKPINAALDEIKLADDYFGGEKIYPFLP